MIAHQSLFEYEEIRMILTCALLIHSRTKHSFIRRKNKLVYDLEALFFCPLMNQMGKP